MPTALKEGNGLLKTIQNTILYHGSYTEVKTPDFKQCKTGKDFGIGFYTTTDKQQAVKFAKRVAKIHGQPYGVLNCYEVSDFCGLAVHEFETVNDQWLHCIVGFRSKKPSASTDMYQPYDVLIGKIADDNTSLVLNAYAAGAYGPVGSARAVQTAISNLIPDALRNQITLRSEAALSRIHFLRSEQIWL